MPDDLSLNIAFGLWIGLGFVALLYWNEWDKARREGRALPPHGHPVLLLSRAVRILYRLWPLVVLFFVSLVAESLHVALWHHRTMGTWSSHPSATLAEGLVSQLGIPSWVVSTALFSNLTHEAVGAGSLVAVIGAAAGLWCAIANPWKLSRRSRVLAATGAVFAITTVALSLFVVRGPFIEGRLQILLMTPISAVSTAFVSALVMAIVWWVGIKGRLDGAASWRSAESVFVVGGIILLAATVLGMPMFLLFPSGVLTEMAGRISIGVSQFISFAFLVLVWVEWTAVSKGSGVRAAFTEGLGLVWRRRVDLALLIVRLGAVMAPIRILLLLRSVPVAGMDQIVAGISGVVSLWLMVAGGLAYASLTDQFPSAVAQAGEEAVPPNLPGDVSAAD